MMKFISKFDKALKEIASKAIDDNDKSELEMSISELNDFKYLWLKFKRRELTIH